MRSKRTNCSSVKHYRSSAFGCLGRTEPDAVVDANNGLSNGGALFVEVEIPPPQSQSLAASHARRGEQ
jgi:hypothetical protein